MQSASAAAAAAAAVLPYLELAFGFSAAHMHCTHMHCAGLLHRGQPGQHASLGVGKCAPLLLGMHACMHGSLEVSALAGQPGAHAA